MATEAELIDALQKAHAAGAEDHARILANEIVKLRGEPSDTQAATRAAQFQPTAAIPQEPQKPDTSLAQNLGVVNKALSPYALAATGGFLAGGPVGAGVGLTALGVGDIGTHLYNAVAPTFGGSRMASPSDTIRQGMVGAGFARDPQTNAQQMLYEGASGAGAGVSGAAGFNALRGLTSGTTNRVMGVLAENPGNQAVAGAGGAIVPTAMNQMGVTNPYALMGGSLAGHVLGGAAGSKVLPAIAGGADRVATTVGSGIDRATAAVTGKPYEPPAGPLTAAQLKARAEASFKTADESGAVYDPQKFKTMIDDLKTTLENKGYFSESEAHSPITGLLKRADKATTEAQKISWMQDFREAIGYARNNESKDIRRMAGMMSDNLDAFITNPENAVNATPSAYSYQPTAPAARPTAPVPTRAQPSAPTANNMSEWNRVTQGMAGPAPPRAYEPVPIEPTPATAPASTPTPAPAPNSMSEWSRVTQRMGTPAPEGLNLPAAAESQANVRQGSEALMSGISDWRKLSRSQDIDLLLTRAANNAGDKGDISDAIRQQFKTVANNPARMNKFSPDERRAIQDIVDGKTSNAVTNLLSNFSPSTHSPRLMTAIYGLLAGEGARGMYHGNTAMIALPIAAATAGYSANKLRNYQSRNAAIDLGQNVRNGFVPQPTPFDFTPSYNALAQGFRP